MYQNSLESFVHDWPEDTMITDEVLENLKETADTGCILCELDGLDEEG